MKCSGMTEWLFNGLRPLFKDGLPAKRWLEELIAEHVNGASNNCPGIVACLHCKDTASAKSLRQNAC